MRLELLIARKRSGLTQREIAEKLQIPRYKYSKIECGSQKNISVDIANAIAQLLNVTIEEIFLPSNAQKMRNNHKKKGI